MGKFNPAVVRRDGQDANHVHALPDGRMTEGMIEKPSHKYYSRHTHLYQMDGATYETDPAEDGPGHTHTSELGETSGPTKADKSPGQPWRKDAAEPDALKGKVQRRGTRFFAISYEGQVVGSAYRQDHAEQFLEDWEKADAELRRA